MNTTSRQLRMIWSLCHQRGFDESTLRAWVSAVSGQPSLRALSVSEASRLIEGLRDRTVELESFRDRVAQRADRISPGQEGTIAHLAHELGWNERQLMGLARRMYRRTRRDALTQREASGLIEALKAIGRRRAA